MQILDMRPGWSKTSIAFRPDLCQPAGIMHGGMIATLVDTGIAHALILTDTFHQARLAGGGIVSVDLRIKYLRPVSEGLITCESTIPKLGRSIIHGESVVVNEEGKEVARGDSIYVTVTSEQLRRRDT
jgi:uncharacterized protein (TIGR00369 family)